MSTTDSISDVLNGGDLARLAALLDARAAWVRRAAEEALVYLGEPSRGAVRHALAAAPPDRRPVYQRIIDQLDRGDAHPGDDS